MTLSKHAWWPRFRATLPSMNATSFQGSRFTILCLAIQSSSPSLLSPNMCHCVTQVMIFFPEKKLFASSRRPRPFTEPHYMHTKVSRQSYGIQAVLLYPGNFTAKLVYFQVQELLSDVQRESVQKQSGEEGDVAGGVADMGDTENPVVMRSRRMSKRISMRESMSEMDRQLKKLFRAIQDEDTNLVCVWYRV